MLERKVLAASLPCIIIFLSLSSLCPASGTSGRNHAGGPASRMSLSNLDASSGLSVEESPFGILPARIEKAGYEHPPFEDALTMGVEWHRPSVGAFWFKVQQTLNDTTLSFDYYDQYYGEVPYEIAILANIGPEGSIEEGYTVPGTYLPVDSALYVRFVKRTVERYDGDGFKDSPSLPFPITRWQVGNEPDYSSKSGFARLQRMTYGAIKEVCPECVVLIGGAAQGQSQDGFFVDPDEYFALFSTTYEPILADLGGEAVDVFDFHWYGDAKGDYRMLEAVYDSILSILSTYDFGSIPVWITEMGSYSGEPEWAAFPAQTEAEQAGDYLKRFVLPLSLGIGKIFCAFGLMEGFGPTEGGYFDHTGLIYDGIDDGPPGQDRGLGVKKLSFYTYKLMTEKLEGSDWERVERIYAEDYVYAFAFTKRETGLPLIVAWWDWFDDPSHSEGDSTSFILDVGEADSVLVTAAVPLAESGAELSEEDYPDFFPVTREVVSGGVVTVNLGEDPLIIEPFHEPNETGEEPTRPIPLRLSLEQNYPNPFNPLTVIRFTISVTGDSSAGAEGLGSMVETTLTVYDLRGRLVRRLLNGTLEPGLHSVTWDGRDESGERAPGGVYLYKFEAGSLSSIRKMLLLE